MWNSMIKIIGIEATGNNCSVALWSEGRGYQEVVEAPQAQGEFILPMVERILKSANLAGADFDVVAFNNGPGSFTGVRLTISVAQGLAFGWGKPVMPISSLQALAYKQYCETKSELPIWVAIDARKQEVYVAACQFQNDKMTIIYPEKVIAPELVPLENLVLSPTPEAIDIVNLAKFQLQKGIMPVSPAEIEPTYLRNKVTD